MVPRAPTSEMTLKDGKTAFVREAAITDAAKLIEHVQRVAEESDYFSTAPGEFKLSVEEEESVLRRF